MSKIYSPHNNNNSHRSSAAHGSSAAAVASNSSQGNGTGGPGGQQAANNVGAAAASAATTRVGNAGPNHHQGGTITAATVAAGPQQPLTPHHPPPPSASHQHPQQQTQQSQANAPAQQQPPTNVPNNSGNNNNSSSGNHHGGHHPHSQQQHHHHHQQHHHNQYHQHHSRQQHGHNLHQNQHHHQHHQHQAHHPHQQQQHHHHHSQQQQQQHHHQPQPHHQPQTSAFVSPPVAGHMVHDVIDHQHSHHPQPQQQQAPVPQQPQQQPPQLSQPQPTQVQQGPGGGPQQQQPPLPTTAPGPPQQQPQNQPQQHHTHVVKHHPQSQQASIPNTLHIHQAQPPNHHPHSQAHPNHHHHNQPLPLQHPPQMAVSPSMPLQPWALSTHPTQTQQSSQAQHHHPHLHHPHPHPQQQQHPPPHHQPQPPQPPSQQPQTQQQPHHLPHPQAPPMMISQQYHGANLFYSPVSHTFVPPTGNAPSYEHPPASSHQPDPVNMNSAQQPVSVNNHHPGNMPLNQLSTPTVISTATTGTTNVHHLSNESMMDTHIGPNRPMTQINQHGQFVLSNNQFSQYFPMVSYALNSYHSSHMPPGPMMASLRVQSDYNIRPHFDSQNPITPIAAPSLPIGPKPPGYHIPINSAAASTPMPAKHRQRNPLPIVHPESKHVFTAAELKSSPANQSITSKDSSISRISSGESPISEKEPLAEELIKSSGDAGASKSSDTASVDEVKSETKLTEPEPTKVEPELEPEPMHKSEPELKSGVKPEPVVEPVRNVSPIQAKKPEAVIGEKKSSPVIEKKIVENGEVEPKVGVETDLVEKVAAVKISDDIDKHENDFEDENESPVKNLTLPNLPYTAGQYSPLNRSGRKKYSIEFLKTVAKELKLDFDTSSNHNQRIDFAPHYVNQNNLRGDFPSSQPLTRRSSQQVITKPRKVIATHSLQQEVELKTAEKPWKAELETEKSKIVEGGEMDTTRLLKVFRGHLNKLTPQKYDSLIEKIGALDLKGSGRLASVIDLVFDKAVDEPGFCELYARMCKVIAAKDNEFCFHLVKKCQEEFETVDLYEGLNVDDRKREIGVEKDPAKQKLLSEELYEDMRIRRKKYLGTIKLIGEMYKLGLLIPKIIGLCMSRLIAEASNENIECLCSLIATVGAKMANEKDDVIKHSLKNTLSVIHDFANNKKTNELFILESRIKFKILDTIDLSKRNWRPRMVENNPKKIDEIHQEVKDEIMRQHHHNHSSQSKSSYKLDDRDSDREREGEREREKERDRENRERNNRKFLAPKKY